MSTSRETFQSTKFAVIMWRRRVEAASSVSTSTRQALVRAELKLAALLEDAHVEALEIDAEIMSTIATAVHTTDTDTLLDILVTPGVDTLVLAIVTVELQARSDEDVDLITEPCSDCTIGEHTYRGACSFADDAMSDDSEPTAAEVFAKFDRVTSTARGARPTVSLVKAYVPAIMPTVGRFDGEYTTPSKVGAPYNRALRTDVSWPIVRTALLRNELVTLQRALQLCLTF